MLREGHRSICPQARLSRDTYPLRRSPTVSSSHEGRGLRVSLGWRTPLGVLSLPAALALPDSPQPAPDSTVLSPCKARPLLCVTADPLPFLHQDHPVPMDSCAQPGSPTRTCPLCPPQLPQSHSRAGQPASLTQHPPPTHPEACVRTTAGSRLPPGRRSIAKLEALEVGFSVGSLPVTSRLTPGKGPLGPLQLLSGMEPCHPA